MFLLFIKTKPISSNETVRLENEWQILEAGRCRSQIWKLDKKRRSKVGRCFSTPGGAIEQKITNLDMDLIFGVMEHEVGVSKSWKFM